VQLTNIGLTELDPTFVAVADRELAWVDGALFYSAAELERTHVRRLDPATGETLEVGPGRWPRLSPSGDGVLAALIDSDVCATRYSKEGTP
jgi:hypothetical protein